MKMDEYLLEACVDSTNTALSAQDNGADRVELCSDLENDGLSPSKKELKEALRRLTIPIKVMLRTRPGDFIYNSNDILDIKRDIMIYHSYGVEEIVFGAIRDNRIDYRLMRDVAQWSYPMKITLHKAIDVSIDPLNDLEKLKNIKNLSAVLSSGQKATALEGSFMLKEMLSVCKHHFELIAAGKITHKNLKEHIHIGAPAYHGRKIVQINSAVIKREKAD